MTSKITLSASYDVTTTGVVDLSPKTWEDVKEWQIKWDTLYIIFEGSDEWIKFDMNSDHDDGANFKRPTHTQIWAGDLEFEEELTPSS